MTLDRLTNAQLEVLVDRLSRHADQAWQRANATRTYIFIDHKLMERSRMRHRIFRRADDLLYRRYTS